MQQPFTVARSLPTTNGAMPDPLGQLSFVVNIPGLEIGRFAECSGIEAEYDVLEYEEGGNNLFVHKLRGRVRYPNLSLARGVTSEDALLKWFFDYQHGAQRPTLTVTLNDSADEAVRRFAFASAFPIKWTGPDARVAGDVTANESLEVGHMGLV